MLNGRTVGVAGHIRIQDAVAAAVVAPGPMGRLCSAHEAGYGQKTGYHCIRSVLALEIPKQHRSGPVAKQLQDLIRQFGGENPLRGIERIRQTLLLLGYDPPCEDRIWKCMVKSRNPRSESTTWLPFLRNHLDASWAADLFIVINGWRHRRIRSRSCFFLSLEAFGFRMTVPSRRLFVFFFLG